MGTLRTPRVQKMLDELWIVLRSNVQHGERAKGGIALEGDSFLGKTTVGAAFRKEFHLHEIATPRRDDRGRRRAVAGRLRDVDRPPVHA